MYPFILLKRENQAMEGVTDSMKITNYTQEFITDDNNPLTVPMPQHCWN